MFSSMSTTLIKRKEFCRLHWSLRGQSNTQGPRCAGEVGGGFVNCDLLCFKSLPFLVPRPRSSTRFVFPRPSDVCLSGLRDNTHVNCCKPQSACNRHNRGNFLINCSFQDEVINMKARHPVGLCWLVIGLCSLSFDSLMINAQGEF